MLSPLIIQYRQKNVIHTFLSGPKIFSASPPAPKVDTKEKIAANIAELTRRDSSDHLQGHDLIHQEQTGILNEKLSQGFKFARICSVCFIQRRVKSF